MWSRDGSLCASGSASIPVAASPSAASNAAFVDCRAARPSSSSAVVAAAGRHKVGTGVTALLGIVVLLAAGYGVYSLLTRHRMRPFRNFTVTKLTEEGNAALVAISPDGKYILSLMRDSNGLASLWLRNVPTNSNTQVQPPADVYYNGLRFSPDGNYLYFVRSDPGNAELKYLVSRAAARRHPRETGRGRGFQRHVLPDGRKIAFMRYDNPEPGKYRLIVRSLDSGEETVLTSGLERSRTLQPCVVAGWQDDPVRRESAGRCPDWTDGGGCQQRTATSDSRARIRLSRPPTWLPDGHGAAGGGSRPIFELHAAADCLCTLPGRAGWILSRATRTTILT